MIIERVVPVFQVASVERSIAWYEELLEFKADPFPAQSPYSFAMLHRDRVEVMLQRAHDAEAQSPRPYRWDLYVRLTGESLRHLYAQLSQKVTPVRALERTFYGMAEFEVADPDGHNLCFAEALADLSDLSLPKV